MRVPVAPSGRLIITICFFFHLAPANSQTLQDTIDFIFQDTIINGISFSENHNAVNSEKAKTVTVTNSSCIISVRGDDVPSGYWKGMAHSQPISATIDFNKLVAKTAKSIRYPGFGDVASLDIEISGDPDSVNTVSWHRFWDPMYNGPENPGVLHEDKNTKTSDKLKITYFKSKSARANAAIRYFLSTFCPGKLSKF